jgi:DNA-binding transcriptional regulator YbjK
MASRRERLLDAAITILASRGARDLTHRAVDREAGLPAGSASNVFRTRAALIDGVLDHLIDQELGSLPALGSELGNAVVDEQFLTGLGALAITHALGPGRRRTLARRALFLEASQDPAASQRLAAASQSWWETIAALLRTAGAPEPERRSRWLLAYIDGLITDQLVRPESDFEPAAALAPAMHGILTIPPNSARP